MHTTESLKLLATLFIFMLSVSMVDSFFDGNILLGRATSVEQLGSCEAQIDGFVLNLGIAKENAPQVAKQACQNSLNANRLSVTKNICS